MFINFLFNCSEPCRNRALSNLILMIFSTMLVALSANNAQAASGGNTILTIETPDDYNFGTWTTGSLSQTTLSCAVAERDNKTKNYKTKVENLDTGDGFFLYRNGVTSSIGNERIQVTIEHTDTLQGSNPYELLYENVYENQKHKAQEDGCPNGDNSSLKVSISNSELSTKLAGNYIGYFDQWIKEGKKKAVTTSPFTIEITIGAVSQVQISRLDTVAFGQYGRSGNLSADEHFCVHSSASGGGYKISVSSENEASGNFYMVDDSTGATIPLSILFSASGSGSGTINMASNTVSAIGDSGSTNCSNTDNATLTMLMTEADLLAAETGSYSERLEILVEPE